MTNFVNCKHDNFQQIQNIKNKKFQFHRNIDINWWLKIDEKRVLS